MREKHQQCDVCDISFKTPFYLREHLRERHDKKNGTAISCEECGFSALNTVHLRKHTTKHHKKERKCGQCHYKTNSEYDLDAHIAQEHKRKRQITCKFWREGRCNNQNCSYLHEMVMCRYGARCLRGAACRFGHPEQTVSHRQNISPWINPAFTANNSYEREFPFLGQRPAGQCQSQCCKVRGRGF